MSCKITHRNSERGFMATIAVVLLATSVMVISLSAISAVVSYADSVYRHESRIQVRMNVEACLDMVSLMMVKDYFLYGKIKISEFDCTANVMNDANGNITITVLAELGDVHSTGKIVLLIFNNLVTVILREVV